MSSSEMSAAADDKGKHSRAPGHPAKAGANKDKSTPTHFRCSHDGCDFVLPVAHGEKSMQKHELRFTLHADHYKQCKNKCRKCIELAGNGEWTERGGRDDYMCRHLNCGYFSMSPRAANRKQAVDRHESAFPIHFNHFREHKSDCTICARLLEEGKWVESDSERWLQTGSSQVIARLQTKETQNVVKSAATLDDLKQKVVIAFPPPRQKISPKSTTTKPAKSKAGRRQAAAKHNRLGDDGSGDGDEDYDVDDGCGDEDDDDQGGGGGIGNNDNDNHRHDNNNNNSNKNDGGDATKVKYVDDQYAARPARRPNKRKRDSPVRSSHRRDDDEDYDDDTPTENPKRTKQARKRADRHVADRGARENKTAALAPAPAAAPQALQRACSATVQMTLQVTADAQINRTASDGGSVKARAAGAWPTPSQSAASSGNTSPPSDEHSRTDRPPQGPPARLASMVAAATHVQEQVQHDSARKERVQALASKAAAVVRVPSIALEPKANS